MVLSCCKWDPQVGDVSTLAPFPILLRRGVWQQLARWAEALAAEACAAERELLERPELFRRLGIPRRARGLLRGRAGEEKVVGKTRLGGSLALPLGANVHRKARLGESVALAEQTRGAGRVIRFDFHWTTEGWRISEANADVPGGFTEASSFTQAMAQHEPSAEMAGNPATRWVDMMEGLVGRGGVVALLVASGYMEDHQVVAYLGERLRRRGIEAQVCQPHHLRWERGRAQFECDWFRGPVDAVVRFYQAEWVAGLRHARGMRELFHPAGPTRVVNPGSAMLIESKRFPMVWDQLKTRLHTWRKLLPETRDPREAPWRESDEWVLKASFCNTGDEVAMRGVLPEVQWRKVCRQVWWSPGGWVAQRRFEPVALDTPMGPMHPCIGVYTIDGKAAGIYGRMSRGPVVDYAAIDVAVLVEKEEG